jgi:hypothetical protein
MDRLRGRRHARLAAAGVLSLLGGVAIAQVPDAPGPRPDDTYLGRLLPLGEDGSGGQPLLRFGSERLSLDQDPLTVWRHGDGGDAGPGAEVDLGYRWLGPTGSVSLFVGPRLRSIDPDFGDVSRLGHATGEPGHRLGLRGELDVTAGVTERWNLGLTSRYTSTFQDYLLRLRPGYRLTDDVTVGPEAAWLGGDDYERMQLGLFAHGYHLGPGRMGLKLGLERDQRAGDYDGYLGLRFERPF